MKLSSPTHFTYWKFPLIISTILVLMNYSGISVLTTIISPPINREFGLLEHLQLLLIAFSLVYSIKSIKLKEFWLEKLAYVFLSFFFLLLFLEEIDYGIHYYEYFIKGIQEDKSIVRNFHNQGDNNFYLRQASYAVMVIMFILLPILKSKIKNRFISYFCAHHFLVYSFMVYLFIGQLSRWLPRWGMQVNESLRGNHQEFEELVLYYIIFLFVYEIGIIKGKLFQKDGKLTTESQRI